MDPGNILLVFNFRTFLYEVYTVLFLDWSDKLKSYMIQYGICMNKWLRKIIDTTWAIRKLKIISIHPHVIMFVYNCVETYRVHCSYFYGNIIEVNPILVFVDESFTYYISASPKRAKIKNNKYIIEIMIWIF